MSRDPLLSEEWPTVWVPFSVDVRPDGTCLHLVATGRLDGWTAGALLRNLIAVCEPPYTEVHLDLRQVDGAEDADEVLARCRAFAESRRIQLRVTEPPAPANRAGGALIGLPAAGL